MTKKVTFSSALQRRQFKSSKPSKPKGKIAQDALKRRILHRRRLS